jgi:hypothetical protein
LIDRAFKPLGKESAKDLPFLYRLAEERYPDLWRSGSREEALEALILHASLKLAGRFGEPGVISNQEAAFWLFNLDGGSIFPHIRKRKVEDLGLGQEEGAGEYNKKYSEIHRDLRKHAKLEGLHESSIRRSFTKLRRALAEALLHLDSVTPLEATDAEETVSRSDGGLDARPLLADFYVSRPEYEAEIRRVRESTTRLLWLHGDAGTGKTRLARAANQDVFAEHLVPVLHAADRAQLEQELAKLISDSGMDAGNINATNVWALFNTLLIRNEAPPVIVFDDVAPETDIISLIGGTGRSLLIFTSQYAPPTGARGESLVPPLQVGEMETGELQTMLRSRLPQATDTERARLASAVGGRPLAIEHSCSFLRSTGMSVADYCAALSQRPAHLLELAGGRQGRTLTRLYELTLERLAAAPEAIRALDYILFTAPGLLTDDMLAFLWMDSIKVTSQEKLEAALLSMNSHVLSVADAFNWPGVTLRKPAQFVYVDPVAMAELRAALSTLADFGLVRSDGGRVVMHQLTRAVMRELRSDQAPGVYQQVRDTVIELLEIDEWEPGEPLMGDTASWAPHVVPAIAQFDTTDSNILALLSLDEVKHLSLLGAMVVRAFRQIGVSTTTALNAVKHLYAIVATRALWQGYDEAERRSLFSSFFGFYTELMSTVALDTGFSRAMDGVFTLGEVSTQQRQIANRIRFEFDTEWEPSHNLFQVRDSDQSYPKEQKSAAVAGFNLEQAKNSAGYAVVLSRVYYDQCRWQDAIAALEHAFTCYIRIGGDIGAIRGAIDAARRLACVYLRAGPAAIGPVVEPLSHLDRADQWLAEARQVRQRRSLAILNNRPSRFRLYDALLDAQLKQAATEVALTRQLLIWDSDPSADFSLETITQFVTAPYPETNGRSSTYSRLEEAEQAFALLQRIRGLRFVPEFRMHIVRLLSLIQDLRGAQHLGNLQDWFSRERLSYQLDLLNIQYLTFSAPATALLFTTDSDEVLTQLRLISREAYDEAKAIREAPVAVSDHYYMTASTMRMHGNAYWHARGLAATLIIGVATEREQPWIDDLRAELDQAVAAIGRTDWIEKANAFGDTNGGLWLLGY